MTLRVLVLLVMIGGALLAHVSMNLHPRFLNLPESMASQQAIYQRMDGVFDGVPDTMQNWRNRMFLPYLIEAASHAPGMTYGRAYLFVRWGTACLALAAFLSLARLVVAPDLHTAGAVTLLFGLSLIPTFLHIYEIPSDFMDAAFFCWLIGFAIKRQRVAFALTLLLALFNRESAIFALVVWISLHGIRPSFRDWWHELIWCGLLGVAGTILVTWLRIANASHVGATGLQTLDPARFWSTNWRLLVEWWSKPSYAHPYFYLTAYVSLLALSLPPAWPRLPDLTRRLFIAGLVIFGISIVSNNLNELRIFIPTLVLTTLTLGVCFAQSPGYSTAPRTCHR